MSSESGGMGTGKIVRNLANSKTDLIVIRGAGKMLFVRSALGKDASYRRQVEECAFEHGISVADVMQVVGIELRDELLRARGATTPSES